MNKEIKLHWTKRINKILKPLSSVALVLFAIQSAISLILFRPFNTSIDSIASTTNSINFYQYITNNLGNFYVQMVGWPTAIILSISFMLLTYEIIFKKRLNYSLKTTIPAFITTIFLTSFSMEILPYISGGLIGFSIKEFIFSKLFTPYNYIVIICLFPLGFYTAMLSTHLKWAQILAFAKMIRKKFTANKHTREVMQEANITDLFGTPIKSQSKAADKKPQKTATKTPIQKELAINTSFRLPTLDLLDEPKKQNDITVSQAVLQQNANLLESFLKKHKILGHVSKINPGPVITQYEFAPEAGVKVSSILNREKDIALNMSAISTRISPIPGKNVIGIELPNVKRKTVFYKELLDNNEFKESSMKLPMAIGQDTGGKPVYVDLAKMPHLLVAGTTGSGKSVAINSMIMSLLYKMRPDECKFIMIDPKMVEFSAYNDIPHLITPVVIDSTKAVVALKWAVNEMERRYELMSKTGAKNLESFNEKIGAAKKATYIKKVQIGFNPETGDPIYEKKEIKLEKFHYIVIVVDEFADLMIVAGKEVETAVMRIAQKARAVGMHLILATQRPSVDVITGVIKANFPSRISLKVTSDFDSKTILGTKGAEQLLGMGDMFLMQGGGKLVRVHGAYVSEKETEKVCAYLRKEQKPNYVDGVTNEEEVSQGKGAELMNKALGRTDNSGKDEDQYREAVRIVIDTKKTSISFVQRSLRIGYNKAADIIDRMEKEGILSHPDSTGKRQLRDN